ncbi:MULE transposase domain-containing protein [Cynara cardunculus var. scolymus]|uniref:MULE transposase domain-containing protein n=1 Tax=Cynara cardunculus var. scolymus TaxID=59895 RepID=A0A103XUY7_CYNCS|nr:MULE transposase domain-containing protein [Cynara cardunculus var. scolymus]
MVTEMAAIVPLKKMIAICQYGGEFETNEDGSMSYIGGEAYAVDLDENMQLSGFKQEIAETIDSTVDGMLIKYFLPANKKNLITVSKDKDFNRMVSYYKESDQLEVFIMKEAAPAKFPKKKQPARRSQKRPAETEVAVVQPVVDLGPTSIVPLNEIIDIETTNEIAPISDPISINPFPTSVIDNEQHIAAKQWENLITGVGQRFHSLAEFREALRNWVGNLIKEKVKDSPKIKPKDIANDLKREYGIELNYSQARRAKEYAREQLLGSYKDAYSELPYFCEKIMETNPGSLAIFNTKEDSSFHRLFVSFHASISGFIHGCRPLIFLNSTPLNSRYQGMLLSATAADADDGAFPVAFAVVDEETDDNWRWFLCELKLAVSVVGQITFVADFQKGLRESLPEIFGAECYHAYCLGYLAEKLNKDLTSHFSHDARRLMVEDLYAAAHAPKLEGFEKCTEDIKAISLEAYNWIIRSEPEHWANAFFGGLRYNHMTSNFGHLFYAWVSEANELPITQMIDELRGKMMQLIYTRRVESSQWITRLTPSMEEKLKNEIFKAHSVQVLRSHGSKFEVRFGEMIDIVDIENWDCSCKGWLVTGLPCCHAIAVLESYGRSPYDHCSRYFHVDTYQMAYAESIHPIPNVERLMDIELDDGSIVVTPPPTIRTPGRTKIRKVPVGQVGPADFLKRQLQCGKCKGLGHNKRSCKITNSAQLLEEDRVLGNDDLES